MAEDSVKAIKPGDKRDWEIDVESFDGSTEKIEPALLKGTNTRIGIEVRYGLMPEGYDSFSIKEPGGAVIVPYVLVEGELYIGTIQQKRSLTGGYQTEAPRGFSRPGEIHEESAKREVAEETGASGSLVRRVYRLLGKPVNPNPTFFEFNPHKGEGVVFYGLKLKNDEVVEKRKSENPSKKVFVLRPDLKEKLKGINEKIKPEGLRFFHVDLLQNSADGFTLAALGKIQTDIRRQAREVIEKAKVVK